MRAILPRNSRTSSPCVLVRRRAFIRNHSSYSSRRLETRVSFHREAGGRRSSARKLGRSYQRVQVDHRSPPGCLQFRAKLFPGADRLPRRNSSLLQDGRRHPSLANRLGKIGVCKCATGAGARRRDLRHDAVAVGYEHRLACGGQADVFAEPVFQYFQSYGAHAIKVASRSFLSTFIDGSLLFPAEARVFDGTDDAQAAAVKDTVGALGQPRSKVAPLAAVHPVP